MLTSVIIDRLRAEDLDAALSLTRAEGWPHTSLDWELHYRLGRGWAAWSEVGELVATALWWPRGEREGTLGLIVVRQDARGQGIAGCLMRSILADAGDRCLSLVATEVAQPLYRTFGFVEQGSIHQHQGVIAARPARVPQPGLGLRALEAGDYETLFSLDQQAMTVSRRHLLEEILPGARGVIANLPGDPVGFALVRPAGRGKVVGPVIADSAELATALCARLLSDEAGFIRIDVPDYGKDLRSWLSRQGLPEVDRGTVMIRGQPPDQSSAFATYGLVSQALG